MRQFLLADKVAYGADLPLAAGAVAFTYLANGKETIDADGTKITDKFYINLGREANGPVVLPAYKKHLTFVKGVYQAATTFSANLTIRLFQRIKRICRIQFSISISISIFDTSIGSSFISQISNISSVTISRETVSCNCNCNTN